MRWPHLPPWLVYGAIAACLLVAALIPLSRPAPRRRRIDTTTPAALAAFLGTVAPLRLGILYTATGVSDYHQTPDCLRGGARRRPSVL